MKRNAFRLTSALLILCMALALLPGTALAAEASGHCGRHVTQSYGDGTLSIQGTGPMEDFHDHGGHHASAPLWCSSQWEHHGQMRSAIIGEGVTSVGAGAFEMCGSLTGVRLPASLTAIEEGAFLGCLNLKDVYYGGSESQWRQIAIDDTENGNDPILTATIHYNSAAPSVSGGIPVIVNGVAVQWTDYAPVRALAEYFGYTVGWDDATRTVSITG